MTRSHPNVIPEEKLARLRELVQEGELSQSAIARMLGINLKTVWRLAHGLYRSEEGNARLRAYKASRSPRRVLDHREEDIGRCLVCGGMVYLPCLACKLRRKLGSDQHETAVSGQEKATEG